MTQPRSSRGTSPTGRVLGIGLVAVLTVPIVLGSVRTSGRIIVPPDEVVREDLYAFGSLVIIEGTLEGDLFAIASEVRVPGVVEGDVMALAGRSIDITGRVDGAVRAASLAVELAGSVGDDVALLAVEADLSGEIGRDAIVIAGETSIGGEVGRDVRLQGLRLNIQGDVGRDVLARVDSLRVGGDGSVGGDVLYTAGSDADVADGAVVAGLLTRRTALTPVWARAVGRAVSILSLLALVVSGLIGAWVFRGTALRSVALVAERPWRSAIVGGAMVVVPPLLAVPLFLTLVGIPLALFLLLAWAVALLLGPLPAVTHLGSRVLRGRGGLAGGLIVGAVLWRGAIWLLPLIAGLLYAGALLVGLGAFAQAGWSQRAAEVPSGGS